MIRDPSATAIRAVVCDLNGQPRGKRYPAAFANKLKEDGVRFPYSALNLDIWGEDIEDSPLVFDSGDKDGVLRPTERGFLPMPWLKTPTALMPLWMYNDDGHPFAGDPRHALNTVLRRYSDSGLTPVVATEMEFYLIDDSASVPTMPASPRKGERLNGGQILSSRQLDAFDDFFTDLYEGCAAMGIPAQSAISEGGAGQFEIDIAHQPDALKAADDAWFFKMLTQGLAHHHGFSASFMAKPYESQPGNGMHTHFSVLDCRGGNIFDDGSMTGTVALRHAIAGLLNAAAASTLIFAPHANSYDRLVPASHAPTGISWAYDNRTAAVRVPAGPPSARRIEHRVPGGDANPYLMLAAVLGAALNGIEAGEEPAVPPITGNAYAADLPRIPGTWAEAIEQFATEPGAAPLLPGDILHNLTLTKRQEMRRMAGLERDEQIALYLDML